MKALLTEIRGAFMATLVLAVVCCGIYPLLVYGVAQLAFPRQANGSLILAGDGTVRGSKLIGQGFTGAKYFHPRPSAAGDGYDAANSGGSNLGPTSRRLERLVQERITAYRIENALGGQAEIPADAGTASSSGLDPHISPRNAERQIARVAKARNLSATRVRALVARHTDPPGFGVLGEPGVNVLMLNLALDTIQ